MANSLFAAYKQVALGDNAITGFTVPDWEGGSTMSAVLVDSADDTINVNTDQDLADILAGARVATANLASITVAAAANTVTVDAADTTFTAVTGDQSEQVVIYMNTGTEATSLLCVFFDTFSSGMPVTPNGGNITIQWNASGIWSW
jgi:hypothetical protein